MTGVDKYIANKKLILEIDELTEKIKELPRSRELDIVIMKLEEASLWMLQDYRRIPYTDKEL